MGACTCCGNLLREFYFGDCKSRFGNEYIFGSMRSDVRAQATTMLWQNSLKSVRPVVATSLAEFNNRSLLAAASFIFDNCKARLGGVMKNVSPGLAMRQ